MTLPARDDRRSLKSRQALLSAFRALLFETGYGDLTTAMVAGRANVGRSTLYEHFGGKPGLLRASLAGPFGALAGIVDGSSDLAAVTAMVDHFRANRRLAGRLLEGPSRPFVVRTLADLIETPLIARGRSTRLPGPLAALQLAEAQLGLIQGWLTGGLPCRAEHLAEALVETSMALVAVYRRV
jgi:AcrR family transcriptional regulator